MTQKQAASPRAPSVPHVAPCCRYRTQESRQVRARLAPSSEAVGNGGFQSREDCLLVPPERRTSDTSCPLSFRRNAAQRRRCRRLRGRPESFSSTEVEPLREPRKLPLALRLEAALITALGARQHGFAPRRAFDLPHPRSTAVTTTIDSADGEGERDNMTASDIDDPGSSANVRALRDPSAGSPLTTTTSGCLSATITHTAEAREHLLALGPAAMTQSLADRRVRGAAAGQRSTRPGQLEAHRSLARSPTHRPPVGG